MAVSRPEPGPFTTTSTLRTPCSIARRAAVSAASCAANGVDFREPLKPTLPADAQAITFPSWSAIEMIVLRHNLDTLDRAVPAWLDVTSADFKATVRDLPLREQIDVPVREQLIVELYSK